MSHCGCELSETNRLERTTLRMLLAINAVMFAVESVAGWVAESTGLLADSLDMLADASVYGVALYAVGRSASIQVKSAFTSGVIQILLGVGVIADVARRYVLGSHPESIAMMSIGAAAFVANVTCLILLSKHRQGGVHMKASWIFSTNDVIANIGVIVSGTLVRVLQNRLPDLLIGTAIAVIVVKGGFAILRETKKAQMENLSHQTDVQVTPSDSEHATSC